MQLRIVIAVSLLLAWCAASLALADAPAPTNSPTTPASPSYVLGPEDAITVTVLRHPEFSGDYLVPPHGMIEFPAVGRMAVTGLTLTDLTDQITQRLTDRLRKPSVSITLRATRPQRLNVLGAVAKPGVFDLREGGCVVAALAEAGGLTLPNSQVRISVVRDGKVVQQMSGTAINNGDPAVNTPLQSDDVVKVDSLATVNVIVNGRVKQPGPYQIREGDGLVEALSVAGGALDDAALSQIRIVHADKEKASETVNLAPALLSGKEEYNVKLHAGDLVIVPQDTERIAVLGYVTEPGYFPLPDAQKIRLADALSMAKGPDNKRGGIAAVAVLHTNTQGKQERNIYNLQKYLKTGDPRDNPEVKAGDIVYVPETSKPNWDWIWQGIASIGTFANPLWKL